jgi:TfoX/Sxy family transcriptional regulator of competence genes
MADDPYAEVKAHFEKVDDVTVNAGKGSQGLKYGTKMFAMFYKGDLVVKLSPERVGELVASGEAQAFDPGTGTPMKDRVLIPEAQCDEWIAFCEESREYEASL